MPSDIPISFGKTTRDKFGYLIITGVFLLISATIVPWIVKDLVLVSDEYYEKYLIFYQICGSALGFLIAQVYIRFHSKKIRRRLG